MELNKDFVVSDENREDIGALLRYKIDLSFGENENNFLMEVPLKDHMCKSGYFVYMEDTEYGGIVDKIKVRTEEKTVSYFGRTFHGILESKVIEPDPGFAYYKATGEANTVIGNLINRLRLSELFIASEEDTGLYISNYQFERYTKAYTAFKKMLNTVGAKLKMSYKNKKITLSVVPAVDYTEDFIESDRVDFEIEKNYKPINHLICLGSGKLEQRQIIHLYADANGNISKVQSIFGLEERTDVYDYANVESLEELEKGGVEKLTKYQQEGTIAVKVRSIQEYDIGDIVGGKEWVTDISVKREITQKIVTIENGKIKIENKAG